jgi:cation:H+ antiporter
MISAIITFIIGLTLIIFFSEKLVEATVGTSLGFGVSAFLISVIFIGFDPENLGLGVVASYGGSTGIAVGTIIGSAMVAISLALGITAMIAPIRFKKMPIQVPIVSVVSVVLFGILSFDGLLSRFDGFILLISYGLAIWYLIHLGKKGLNVESSGETAELLEEGRKLNRWKAFLMLLVSLLAIVVGSEMVVWSSESIISELGLSEAIFGMTILAVLVSIEELARELPAALKGRYEITFGNVIGSVLAFFLFNAGVISLVRPVPIESTVFQFYLPLSLATVLFVTLLLMNQKSIPRWAGVLLVIGYLLFFSRGYW